MLPFELTSNIATIGENQSLRRAAILSVNSGVVTGYVHNAAAPGMGKIGVLVALESSAGADVLEPLGKQLAMHIAAANPLAPTPEELRRLAIYNNYRALVDVSPGGGYGTLYGPLVGAGGQAAAYEAVARDVHDVAVFTEALVQVLHQFGFVFDDKDTHRWAHGGGSIRWEWSHTPVICWMTTL